MLKKLFPFTITAIVVSLASANLFPVAKAATPTTADVGLVYFTGSQTTGSTLGYEFDLNSTVTGPLVAKAKIKGKGLKGTFPDLNTTAALGVSKVTGTQLTLPSTFTGTATFKLTVYLNGKKVGKRELTGTITPPGPPPLVPVISTNLYDVGFENNVTLNGSIIPTDNMGPVTYTWTQTSGKTVALSANNVAAPSFTTDALTNFVTMGTAMYVNDVDEDGTTNQVYVTREDRFATNNVNSIALDAEQAEASAYAFRLLVSDGSITRTGLFTVACSIQTPAQPNIPLGVTAYYRGGTNSVNWSLISRPVGSTASLVHTNGLIPELRPDVTGSYVIKDNITGQSVTNVAATWVGYEVCAICHGPGNNVNQEDKVSLWKETKHASFFQKAIDGEESSHYSENCIACHTVGDNKAPTANNNGFDDIAAALGWNFPTVLAPGNFAAMPAALQAKANIQCESCHGPGSQHPGAPSVTTDVRVCGQCHQDGNHHVRPQQWEISPHSGGFESIASSRGTNPQCARCHSPVGYTQIAKGNANVGTTNSVPTGTGPLTCQTCHNPHDKYNNEDRHQLRVYDTALLGNPYFRSNDVTIALGETITTADLRMTNSNLKVTGLGNSATCVTCHNGRQLPTQVQTYGTTKGQMFYQVGGPHDQLAGEAFLGVGMYDYGKEMGNSFHTGLANCQSCHMYQLKAGDTILTNDLPVTITADNLANYANIVGNHTFKMDYQWLTLAGVTNVVTDVTNVVNNVTNVMLNVTNAVSIYATNVVDNIAACNQCHEAFEPVESFDFQSVYTQDYDGDGVIEGTQSETKGVMANLATLLMWGNGGTNGIWATTNATAAIEVPLTLVTNKVAGVTNSVVIATGISRVSSFSSAAGYYSANPAATEAQRKAVWNWLAAYREGSWGVHNTQYIIRLLQTTYTDLSTNYYGDVTKTYQNAFPNAYLR